jgi:hypothetical protein
MDNPMTASPATLLRPGTGALRQSKTLARSSDGNQIARHEDTEI